tara:strand:- start:230 stop:469 length:240 start_codon:yes stop_codon:yes gene_type:complete
VFIFGKIKTYIIGALALSLPIIYVMGQVAGRSKEKTKILEDELDATQNASEFYKKMAEHETDPIPDRKSLISRLRSNGL